MKQLTPDLTVSEAVCLISKLEQAHALILWHWKILQQLIASCVDQMFQVTEVGEKQFIRINRVPGEAAERAGKSWGELIGTRGLAPPHAMWRTEANCVQVV